MATINKKEIEKAITELVQFATDHDIDPKEFKDQSGGLPTFKQYLYDKKVNDIVDKLTNGSYREYLIEAIVFDNDEQKPFLENQLILEWEQYKKVPKTNLTYRYDSGNTNTKTKDHIHVYSKNNQLYSINKDGTAHDGSTAKLGGKEIKFLKSIGFNPPANGILEWFTLDKSKTYQAINLELLFS